MFLAGRTNRSARFKKMALRRFFLDYAVVLILAAPSYAQEYWPTHGWRFSTPEAQGLESGVLADALDFIHEKHIPIHSLLIERNGSIVLDAYFFPFSDNQLHDLASVTKSVTATLVGIAIGEKKLSGVNEPVLPLFPAEASRNTDPRKAAMKIEDLLSMRSGLDCDFDQGELTLAQMQQSPHWIHFMLGLQMVSQPGNTFVYCSGGMHVLSGVVTKATGKSELDYARAELFSPLGIKTTKWPADADGISHGWGDLHLQPRDMAKLGYLWLHNGDWDGRQIVPADYLSAATAVHSRAPWNDQYGYGFWVYPNRTPPIYEGNGRGGQRITVIPSKNMVVVFTGGGFEPGDVGKFIGAAMKSGQPLPENRPAVARLKDSVKRAARAPSPQPVQPPPALAAKISGKIFEFDQNPLGLKELSLTFKPGAEASLRLSFIDRRFTAEPVSVRPIGLDGVPRLSPHGRFDLPIGLKGYWKDDETYVFDYDEIANIDNYQFELKFGEKGVFIKLGEKTGTVQLSLAGKLKPY